MPTFQLHPLDLIITILYLVMIIAIGFYVARKTRTTEDYFLAGRSLTWWLIGFSLFASNISSSSLIGLAGDAYSTGIAVYNYEWFAVLVLVFFIIFFLPLFLKARVYTMPEFLELRFDARSRYYVSGITIVGNILLETAGALYAGALVVQLVYPGVPLWQIVAVLAVLSGLYTAAGGLKAVVYTDAIQAVLLLAGAILVSIIAFNKVGSWEAVMSVVPAEQMKLVQPLDDPNLPWLGLITGLPLLGIYYWCNNQYMVQRTLGAKNLHEGRQGALFAGLLKLPVLFIMVFPGLFARVLYPELTRPDAVFATLIFDLLPIGIRGLVLIALIAAIMSSLDSTLNAVSTLVTMDFVKKLKPETSNERLVLIGRITTLVVMVLGVIWAPQILRFPSLWKYLQGVLAYISPPIVACFLVGIFWKRASATGSFAALLVGFGIAVTLVLTQPGIHFLYVAALLFVACVLTIIIVSLVTPAPDAEAVRPFVWSRDLLEAHRAPDAPWYTDYRIQSALLLVVTFIIVGFYL